MLNIISVKNKFFINIWKFHKLKTTLHLKKNRKQWQLTRCILPIIKCDDWIFIINIKFIMSLKNITYYICLL